MGSSILYEFDLLSVSVGDIQVTLSSDDPGMKLGVPEATENFLVDGGTPDAKITAAWSNLRKRTGGDRIFDSGGLWQLYRRDSDYLFRFHSPVFGELPYKQARFNA